MIVKMAWLFVFQVVDAIVVNSQYMLIMSYWAPEEDMESRL